MNMLQNFQFKLHILNEFPMAMLRLVSPNTIPLLDCIHLISSPIEVHLHNCHRQNDKTIWKKEEIIIFII